MIVNFSEKIWSPNTIYCWNLMNWSMNESTMKLGFDSIQSNWGIYFQTFETSSG